MEGTRCFKSLHVKGHKMTSYPNSEANVKVEPRVWEPDYLDILIKLFANKFVTGDPNQFLLRVSKRKFFYSVFTCIFAG